MTATNISDGKQSSDAAGGWLTGETAALENDPDFVAETLALPFTERALQTMHESGISRAHLGRRMGVSRAHVSYLFDTPPR